MVKRCRLIRQARHLVHQDEQPLSKKTAATLHKFSEQATALAQSLSEQANFAPSTNRGKDVRANLAIAAKEHTSQISDVQKKIADDMTPVLRDVATQAASLALELWQTARDHATEAAEAAQHEISPKASEIVNLAERRAISMTDKAERAVARTKDVSKQAVDASVDTSKSTGALLFWAGAATGVILFAMISKERRDQVFKYVESTVSQVRNVIQDFQGYDEEFDLP